MVWVGGVALALGGIFLVRYSIEQGWFGPGMRIFLGALLALALIAAGEWTRRKENLSRHRRRADRAHPEHPDRRRHHRRLCRRSTPPTRSTTSSAPAPPSSCSASSRWRRSRAALLHGPALAGLGLVGAYVTPLLVSTDKPNFWALYIYLAVVTAAAFALARVRMWRWLALTAVAFGLFWTLPGLATARRSASPRMPSTSSSASRWSRP